MVHSPKPEKGQGNGTCVCSQICVIALFIFTLAQCLQAETGREDVWNFPASTPTEREWQPRRGERWERHFDWDQSKGGDVSPTSNGSCRVIDLEKYALNKDRYESTQRDFQSNETR